MILPADERNGPQQSPQALGVRIDRLEASVAMLEGSLASYESIFLRSPVPAIVYDAESMRIVDANEGSAGLFGISRDELIGTYVGDLLGPRDLERRRELLTELARANNVVGPLSVRVAGQLEVPVRMTVFPLRARAGVEVRLAMVQRQTGGHMAEDALRASEERYRDLFENANDTIFLHDLTGKLLAVNRAGEALTGYSRAEILGQGFDLLLAPEARAHMLDSIRAHLGGSPTQHYELPIVSKTGVKRFLEVSTRVLYVRGHPVAVQGIGRDITERKLSEQKLMESARELQMKNEELRTALHLAREATQLKEQFLANTSHELRTPMNGIMGMTDLLRDTPLQEEQLEYVDAVSQCANDLLRIINDLLDVSQIDAGRLSITSEKFDVRESLNAVVKMLGLKASAKGLRLTCDVAPDVPQTMAGDSVRFRQVLMNLIANAIKFTQAGNVRVCMEVTGEGHRLLCRVVDTGIGVEESVRERIFEAFFQADGTLRRRYGGTGLGLTISKQLVELLGGRIGTYNNETEPGATFWFELPLRSKEDTEVLIVAQAG